MISFHNNPSDPSTPGASSEGIKKATNIFGQPLTNMMPSDKERHQQEKNKKKGILISTASALALGAYSIFFFYGAAMDYIKAPAEIRRLNAEVTRYEEVVLPNLEKAKNLHKSAYDKEFEETITSLETVFPVGEDKLGMVRLLESFAVEVAATFPPFEFTAINIGQPQKKEGYQITPISTSIHSSLAGFERFLALVERSGQIYDLSSEEKKVLDKIVRLMSVSNISVKYRGVDAKTGKDGGVDFSVKLNMYSRLDNSVVAK